MEETFAALETGNALNEVMQLVIAKGDRPYSGADHKVVLLAAVAMRGGLKLSADVRKLVFERNEALKTTPQAKEQVRKALLNYEDGHFWDYNQREQAVAAAEGEASGSNAPK